MSDWNAIDAYLKQNALAAPKWTGIDEQLRRNAGINADTQATLDAAVKKGYLAGATTHDQAYRDYIEANRDNPVEAVARLNGAQFFSDREGIPFQQALQNYDMISKAWYGNSATPITAGEAIANGWKQALADNELNSLWIKKAERKATAEDLARLADLEDNLPPADKYERWLPTQALVAAAQSIPYSAGVMAGSVAGDLAVKGLATLLFPEGSLAIAGLQVFGKVLAAKRVINVGKAVGVAAKVGGGLGGIAAGYQGVAGLEYRDMVKAGMNEDIAWRHAQWSSGLNSAVESLSVMDLLPTALAKNNLVAAAGKVIGEGILKGRFRAPLMKLAGRVAGRAGIGGLEEASQQVITEMSYEMAREASNATGTAVDPKTWDAVAKAIADNFKMGALASIPMGALGEPFQVAHDAKTWKEYLLSEKAKLDTKAGADAALAAAEASPNQKLAKDPSGVIDPTHVYRDPDSGDLHAELIMTGGGPEGVTRAVMKFGDPTSGELNLFVPHDVHPDYVEIDHFYHDTPAPEDLGTAAASPPSPNAQEGTANASEASPVSSSVEGSPREAAPQEAAHAIPESMKPYVMEAAKQLMAQYPGRDIRWSPTDKVGMEIRDELIAGNPRGEGFGLQWYDASGNAGAIRTEEALKRKLFADRRSIGLSEPGQVDAAVRFFGTLARSVGLTPDEYLKAAHTEGVYTKGFAKIQGRDLAIAAQGVRGAISFETVGDLTKSLIHLGDKADISTVVHEGTHGYINFLRANKGRSSSVDAMLADVEKAFGITDWSATSTKWVDTFRKSGETKGYNLSNEEVLAYAVEDYLRNQTLPTDPAARSLIQKLAAWIVDVYKAMRSLRVNLTPEINAVLGKILADEAHPVHEALRAGVAEQEKRSEALKQPANDSEVSLAAIEKNTDPATKPRMNVSTLDEAYALVEASREEFASWTKAIAGRFGARIKPRPGAGLKDHSSAASKITDTEGPGSILDLAGNTLVLESYDKIREMAAYLKSLPEVARQKDRFANPTKDNYRDFLVNVRMGNGAIVEIQVTSEQMLEAKDHGGHTFYKAREEAKKAFARGDISEDSYLAIRDLATSAQESLYAPAFAATREGAIFKAASIDISTPAWQTLEIVQASGAGERLLSEKTLNTLSSLSTANGLSSQSRKYNEGSSKEGTDSFIDSTSVSSINRKVQDSKDAPANTEKDPLFQPAAPTDSPEFKAWFGDSKVVDAEGRPLVVFHGTATRFESFKNKGNGFWFIPSKDAAENYARKRSNDSSDHVIYEVYVRAENPSDKQYPNADSEDWTPYYDLGYDSWISRNDDGTIFTVVVKDPTQIKSINNRGTWDPNDPRLLYQPALESAATFDTWEEFRDTTEATWNWMGDEHADEHLSPEAKDAWYKRVWEEAHRSKETNGGNPEEAAPDAMATFLDDLKKPGGLEAFLLDIGNVDRFALEYERTGAMDEAEFADMEKTLALRDQIVREVHPLIKNTADGVARSGRGFVKPGTRAAILTFIEHGLVDYAALAADMRDDSALKAASTEALGTREKQFGKLKDPRAAKWADLSIADRKRLSDKFDNLETRKKISSGEITSDEIKSLVTSLDEELKLAEDEKATLEKEIASQDYSLSRNEITFERLKKEAKEHEREIIRLNKEIAKAEERQAKLGTALELEGARRSADQLDAARQARETAADTKEGTKAADERLMFHKKWLQSAIADKQRAEKKLAAVQRELKQVKATDRVTQREAVRAAIEKTKAHIREVEARKKAARELREAKFKAADRIMHEASWKTINWAEVKAIRAIQSMIDPRFRRPESWKIEWNGRKWTTEEFKDFAEANPEMVKSALGEKWYKRLEKKGLDELSLQELEELADRVEALASEGRRILNAKNELFRYNAAVVRNKATETLDASGKFQDPGVYGSKGWDEAVKKRTGLAIGKYDQMDDRHFAQVLGNMKDASVFQENLVDKERDCRRKEVAIVERMTNPVVEFMGAHRVDIAKLAQSFVTVDPENTKIGEGKPVELSKEGLMFARLALRDDDSRKALIGGNFFSPEFRDRFRRLEEESGQTSQQTKSQLEEFARRIERQLNKAIDAHLSEDEKALADLMADILDVSFDQFQEAFVVTFNHEMRKVKYYVPIRRQGSTYESLEGEVLEEFKTARGMVTNPNKGMSEERIKIGWTHQKPIKTDLFGIYFDAVKKQAHLIAYADYIKEMNQAFKSNQAENFRYHLTLTHGREAVERFDKLISSAANPDQFKVYAGIDKTIRFMRGALGSGYLGLRPGTALKQLLTSWEPFLPYTGAYMAGSAATAMGKGPWNFVKEVEAKSAILRTRNMNEMAAMVKAGRQEGMQGKLQAYQDKSFMFIEWADRFCVAVGWDAVYRKGLSEGLDEAAANRKADDITLLTQPSGSPQDLAPFYKEGGEAMKIFTQFMSPVSRIWQNWRYDVPAAFINGRSAEGIGIILSYMLTGAVLYAVFGNHSPDDPEKETKRWILSAFTQMTGSVPLIGDYVSNLASIAVTGKGGLVMSSDPLPGISRVFLGADKITKGALEGSWDTIAKGLATSAEGAGLMAGLPVSAAKDVLRATEEGPGALIGIRKGGN